MALVHVTRRPAGVSRHRARTSKSHLRILACEGNPPTRTLRIWVPPSDRLTNHLERQRGRGRRRSRAGAHTQSADREAIAAFTYQSPGTYMRTYIFKSSLFGQPDPKVQIWQAWRIEISYKDIRDYWARLKGQVWGTALVGLRVLCA